MPALQVNTWPADVNEDGIVVSLGRGDGTFAEARRLGVAMAPVTVADFNVDTHLDMIVAVTDDASHTFCS